MVLRDFDGKGDQSKSLRERKLTSCSTLTIGESDSFELLVLVEQTPVAFDSSKGEVLFQEIERSSVKLKEIKELEKRREANSPSILHRTLRKRKKEYHWQYSGMRSHR